MLIGGHVSVKGGIVTAVDNGERIGAEVIQTHPTPAVMWRPLRLEESVLRLYHERFAAAGLQGHYLHAVYLVNLASPKESLLKSSIASLVHYMELAASLDADGVVFHPGSHLGTGFEAKLPQVAAAVREIVDRSPRHRSLLLVENGAGSGGCVGCSFEEVGRIIEMAGSERVAACLDTQHAFASGYDLRDRDEVDNTLAEFDRVVGFERLALVHANDSLRPLGSNADRHANIGEGEIGEAAFRLLLEDERLRRVPWLLEVPGQENSGPNLQQINLLRDCAGLGPAAVAAGAGVSAAAGETTPRGQLTGATLRDQGPGGGPWGGPGGGP